MITRKIVSAADKDIQVASLAVLETMFMLKKSWDEIREKTIQNRFRKDGRSAQSQESAMDENQDPFKEVLCNDSDPIGELEFDLNQLCEVNPELASANLNENELVDIVADIVTKNSQLLTVEEIVNNLNNEPHAESDETNEQIEENATKIVPPTRDKLDDAMETLSKLNLFTDD